MKLLQSLKVVQPASGCGGTGNCTCKDEQHDDVAQLVEAIQERYGQVAERGSANDSLTSSCCGNAASLYSNSDLSAIAPQAAGASAGCGNPVGIAEVKPGETVLDLGSGGGIDCFLAAQATGSEGHVYGVDMTLAMLKLARENAEKMDVQNVTFLAGRIEAVPMPDESVDLVISNCVIALAPDKKLVFEEIMRVLKPGGRFVVSDVLSTTELPEEARRNMAEWVSCIGGADLVSRYMNRISETGFVDLETLSDVPFQSDADGDPWRESLRSVTVRAFKPVSA
ncbi:MAG: arsenite methyltransferase [Chloroflexi bacterium]|nr:arsenite methyltransferase [Chloroflexota bacterium]